MYKLKSVLRAWWKYLLIFY